MILKIENDSAQPIRWHEGLSVGHADIDAQHRRMVDLFNILYRGVHVHGGGEAEDGMLEELLRMAAENFRTEEDLMRAHAEHHPSFETHRNIHRGLLTELRMLRDALFKSGRHVNAKTLNFIRQWLFDHLTHSDRELVDLVRCAGTGNACAGRCAAGAPARE